MHAFHRIKQLLRFLGNSWPMAGMAFDSYFDLRLIAALAIMRWTCARVPRDLQHRHAIVGVKLDELAGVLRGVVKGIVLDLELSSTTSCSIDLTQALREAG
jgi:hypothetical protein